MKLNLTVLFSLITTHLFAQMQFVSPVPGSAMQNPERNIVLRPGSLLDPSSLSNSHFVITGSLSGNHDFKLMLANDKRTINLNPFIPFAYDEIVTVEVRAGLRQNDGKILDGFTFSFSTHREYTKQELKTLAEVRTKWKEEIMENKIQVNRRQAQPEYKILVNKNPGPGAVFFSNFSALTNDSQHEWIIKSNGDSVFEHLSDVYGFDWVLNHNHYLTAFNSLGFTEMYDSNYVLLRTFNSVNGYHSNEHDFQIYPDGHYFLIADDPQIVDMRKYDSSYREDATVMGSVIQEFDASDNLLFEWRSFDHIDIPEAIHQNLRSAYIDAVHLNSIEEDFDGNIIISCRHLDQVDKIDLNTGNFIWRLGGAKNEFTFVNDPDRFNYQHDARRTSNGNITLYDNNNWGTPRISYAKEYKLDEANMKATLVWSYAHPPVNGNIPYGMAMGSVQRLGSGHTLINWGWIPYMSGYPSITETDSNNKIVWEMKYKEEDYDVLYRAHRTPWNPCSRPSESLLLVTHITSSSATLSWNAATGARKYKVQIRRQGDLNWKPRLLSGSVLSVTVPHLKAGTTYEWRVQSACSNDGSINSGFTAIKTFTTLTTDKIADSDDNAITGLKIFPDPASDEITVQWMTNTQEEIAEIQISDLLGQMIYSRKILSSAGGNQSKIDIHSLQGGIYLIRLITNDQRNTSAFSVR